MEFEKRKQAAMAAMTSSELDKSPKGTIDAPIVDLLKTVNLHPYYFTTSSCSGRISIFSHPSATTPPTTAKKAKGGKWVFITHDRADPNAVIDLLFSADNTSTEPSDSELVFRFEPFIVAVECKDVECAQNLVSLAISSGFRESGITSVSVKRVIIAIRCSIRLEVPLGSSKMVMVSPDYVRYLVEIANEKMVSNRKRTDGFLDALRRTGFSVGSELVSPMTGENSDGDVEPERTNFDTSGLPSGAPVCSLTVTPMKIVGSMEKLFLWGHSCGALVGNSYQDQLLIFGGFGGMGRHSRRNYCLLLDPITGSLCDLDTVGTPSPRLGHTCSVVGKQVFIIGGRADPVNILSDVWILNTVTNQWKLVKCTNNAFGPRHRHASAVVGSKIYVFGGLDNDTIYSAMLVFDVDKLQWMETDARGEQPCARHSHTMVAHGSKIHMFGGYNGEKALGDLYTFDINDSHWRKVKAEGEPPYPRFSQSMFVYKDLIGIIGGCPIRQHCQELSLLDTKLCSWNHVTLKSDGKDLFVRSTSTLIKDDLVVIGGGAACYAFGTKFSEPMKIDLQPLLNLVGTTTSCHVNEKQITTSSTRMVIERGGDLETVQNGHAQSFDRKSDASCELLLDVPCWVLKLEKKYAKLGKDMLKMFGWLDLGRKAYSSDDASQICFPVTGKFCDVFQEKPLHSGTYDINALETLVCSKDISHSSALKLLVACGATKHADEVAEIRKVPNSPLASLKEAIGLLIKENGLPEKLLHQLPTRWERLGDLFVLPVSSFEDPIWSSLSHELWPIVARVLGVRRLARQGKVAATGTRDSRLEILVGDNGWVEHCENGILYSFDATKCMFSWGNLSEKLRMARLDCRDEIVVDLFAGIGYFTLPFLTRANAKLLYACEWNPHAIEALRRNLQINSVSDRCIVNEGDNRQTAPKGVADRVCLGLLPSSEGSWVTAVRALREEGGVLHIHGNAKDSEERSWTEHVLKSIQDIGNSEGRSWVVSLEHLERVKWYAPHIRHLVVDLRCSQAIGVSM